MSRPRLVVGVLFASLALAGLLAWEAYRSMREQRSEAEKVLRDYAMIASDEFARRSAAELGFSGFYPLIALVRQEAAKGRLIGPKEMAASADETVRPSLDLLRSTFRYDVADGRLETSGTVAGDLSGAWITKALAADAESLRHQVRYFTEHRIVGVAVHTIVFARVVADPRFVIAGFEADDRAFAPRFQKAVEHGPLFPTPLGRRPVTNRVLFLRVIDPAGREAFRIGAPRYPYLGIRRPFASDYNGILDGFMIEAAFDPAAAGDLVIGGLPRSSLPFLLGLLALAAGLMAIAILQVRREYALSDLRSQFVSRVSHELRTPLAHIRMFAETLLLDRVRSDEERRRSLEIIDRESRRLTHLIENVLRFSRRERGENRVEAVARNAAPLVREILVDFQPLLRGGARMNVSIPDEAFVYVDEPALRQILLNFLDNATKYGPEGQRIGLDLRPENGNVRLSVEDEGPGIPPSERGRIWDPYYRLPRDRDSAVAGTGIGLSVVADLARLMGGRVWVEDADGGGARFVLELRSAPAPVEASG